MLIHIFMVTEIRIFGGFFDESLKRLFEMEIFGNLIKVFTFPFDNFNASLLKKKHIHFFHLFINEYIYITPNF